MLLVAGVDVGSVASKAVVLRDGSVAGRGMEATGSAPVAAAEKALSDALAQAGADREAFRKTVATGYGRRATEVADDTVTEITAAAWGACAEFPDDVGTLIDLGGQDTKVITLDDTGRVMRFLMNDKCAAGTGKFLEVMAHVLGARVEEMSELAGHARQAVRLTATCTVFAESEVISLIHRGAPREEIAAGLLSAIASRIAAMVRQVGRRGKIAFIGGGARNEGIHRALERELGREILVPAEPQFTVALGAALIAAKRGK